MRCVICLPFLIPYLNSQRYVQAAGLRARFLITRQFTSQGILLMGRLVGNIGQSNPPRLPLMAGCWGIVYSDESVYLGKGVCVVRNLTRFD